MCNFPEEVLQKSNEPSDLFCGPMRLPDLNTSSTVDLDSLYFLTMPVREGKELRLLVKLQAGQMQRSLPVIILQK